MQYIGKVTLRLLIDVASVEILADGGESVISDLDFPKPGPWQFGFAYKGEGAPPKVERIAVFPLRSSWHWIIYLLPVCERSQGVDAWFREG